jgi:predicted transcriptional regulator
VEPVKEVLTSETTTMRMSQPKVPTWKKREARDIYYAILMYVKEKGASTKSCIMRHVNLNWFGVNQHIHYMVQVGFLDIEKNFVRLTRRIKKFYRITFEGEKYLELMDRLIKKECFGG